MRSNIICITNLLGHVIHFAAVQWIIASWEPACTNKINMYDVPYIFYRLLASSFNMPNLNGKIQTKLKRNQPIPIYCNLETYSKLWKSNWNSTDKSKALFRYEIRLHRANIEVNIVRKTKLISIMSEQCSVNKKKLFQRNKQFLKTRPYFK